MDVDQDEKWFDRNFWKNKGPLYRYIALFNICCMGFGSYVGYDNPGGFQEALMKRFNISFSEFSLLYSVGTWPNIILSAFGGFLIDRVFGINVATLLYSVIFLVGHLIYSLGALLGTFWCSLLGRFISGIGSEAIYVCLQIYAIQYFKGKELSMVMCMIMSVSKLGSSAVYAISEPLLTYVANNHASSHNSIVGITLFIVSSFLLLPITTSIFLSFMKPKNQPQMVVTNFKESSMTQIFINALKNVIGFPLEFWLIAIINIVFATFLYIFQAFTQEFFKTKFDMSIESANSVTSVFSITGAVVAPFLGIIIDRCGREVFITIIGLLLGLVGHLILTFTSWTPYIGMFILSLSFGLYSGAVLPMLAFIIPEDKIGTAFGVGMSLFNCFFSVNAYIAGSIVDYHGYVAMELYFTAYILAGLLVTLALWFVDNRSTGVLNMSPRQRSHFLKEQKVRDGANEPLKG